MYNITTDEYNHLMSYKSFFLKKYSSLNDEDIESDLNLCIAKAVKYYKPKGASFKTFVLTIMHNQCKTRYQYQKRRMHIILESFDKEIYENDKEWTLYNEVYDDSSPEDVIPILTFVHNNLDKLSKRQREVMDLFLKGYQNKDICSILNIKHNAIVGIKNQAIDKLVGSLIKEFPILKEYVLIQRSLKRKYKEVTYENFNR